MIKINQSQANKTFIYDIISGNLLFRPRPRCSFKDLRAYRSWNTRFSGKPCGSRDKKKGYLTVRFNESLTQVHRIIWCIVNGDTDLQIDHINGVTNDNRIDNLRSVTNKENCKNRSIRKDRASGITGVYFRSEFNRWSASICSDGKQFHLGLHKDFFNACCARKSAERKFDFHANTGRDKPIIP